MEKFFKVFEEYGWMSIFRVLCYPATVFFTTPFRLTQTLWSCRKLAHGKLGEYNRFEPTGGLNSLTYWTLALNFSRYGRVGRSPYVGLGDYPLSRMFGYCLPSLYAYWSLSNLTILIGMFGWWFSHLIWLNSIDPYWVCGVMILVLFSTSFYANTFSLQAYQALGWLFFPLAIFGLLTHQWGLTSLSWLFISLTGPSTIIIGGILCLYKALMDWEIFPVITFLPAGIKMLSHFWIFQESNQFYKSFQTLFKAIGIRGKDAKYKYPRSLIPSPRNLYYGLIYTQFCISGLMLGADTSLLWVGLGVYYLNSTYFRFADFQSIVMTMLTLATITLIQSEEEWLLPSFWLLASPLPYFAGFHHLRALDIVPKCSPFPIKPFLNGMEKFLQPVNKNQKILAAFDNPQGQIYRIFNEFNWLYQLPFYVANKNKALFIPNEMTIFETNYEGAPEFWGREVDQVLENVKKWEVDFVVIYQEEETRLDKKWIQAGFSCMSEFDWNKYAQYFEGSDIPKPKWWLLQPPELNE